MITDGVVFSDTYAKRKTAVMTPLQEGVVRTRFHGGLALMGDSAHKVSLTSDIHVYYCNLKFHEAYTSWIDGAARCNGRQSRHGICREFHKLPQLSREARHLVFSFRN
jgi:hypothetical protein